MISDEQDLAWTVFSEQFTSKYEPFISEKLELKYDVRYGRSLVAAVDIEPNERLIRIPHQALLNIKTVELPLCDAGAQAKLALFLAQAKENHLHEWHAFTDLMPKSFSSIPLTWEYGSAPSARAAAAFFQDPVCAAAVAKQKAQFTRDYTAVGSSIALDSYLWAWLCVNTRCLYDHLSDKNEADNLTLAPVIDFLNHTSNPQLACSTEFSRAGDMEIKSSCAYPAGSEVYITYGAHSNLFLLCEYGFTLPSNPEDFIDITRDIGLSPAQLQVLQDLGYTGPFTVSMSGPSFLASVALVAATVEHEDWSTTPRKLKLLCQGYLDEDQFKSMTDPFLRKLLEKKVDEWTTMRQEVSGYRDLELLVDGWLEIAKRGILITEH